MGSELVDPVTIVQRLPPDETVSKPWKFNNWLIWPQTILDDIDVSDCSDTPMGICYRNQSIEECISKCPTTSCNAGIYVQYFNGESMCVPIRTAAHPTISPLYRLRAQKYYGLDPRLVQVSVFVNTSVYPYPPNLANTIFFGDIMDLSITGTDLSLNTSRVIARGVGLPITLNSNETSNIVLQPAVRTLTRLMQNRPVLYGEKIIILSAGTSYLFSTSSLEHNSIPMWQDASDLVEEADTTFILLPTDPNRIIGDLVTFSDTVAIYCPGRGLLKKSSTNNQLEIEYLTIPFPDTTSHLQYWFKLLKEREHELVRFSLSSKMIVYYCSENQCLPIQANQITPVPFPGKWLFKPSNFILTSGTYKGAPVFRQRQCWNICNPIHQVLKEVKDSPQRKPNDTRYSVYFVVILLCIISICCLVILFRK